VQDELAQERAQLLAHSTDAESRKKEEQVRVALQTSLHSRQEVLRLEQDKVLPDPHEQEQRLMQQAETCVASANGNDRTEGNTQLVDDAHKV